MAADDRTKVRSSSAAILRYNVITHSEMLESFLYGFDDTMDIDEIQEHIRTDRYLYSLHADIERRADELTLAQVEKALLNGKVLEQYEDTGRGESCLIVGFAGELPIHIVCGWRDDKIALITVYVPNPPKFVDPWIRGN